MGGDSSPLVSIVIVTYNSAKYVLETLESARAQAYQNLELLISDDCSSDDTVVICQNWLKMNSNMFVNSQLITAVRNTGIPSNCNRGVNASRGIWIKLIAGDDVLEKGCISKYMDFVMSDYRYQIVLSKMRSYYFSFLDTNLASVHPSDLEVQRFFSSSASDQYITLLAGDVIANTATVFLRKSCWLILNGFDEDLIVEDYPFWLKATKANVKIDFFSDFTVKHRRHFTNSHFRANETLFHTAFMIQEDIRIKYVYPNISAIWRLHYKYQLYTSKFLIRITNNKKNLLTIFLKKFIFSFFNIYRLSINIFRLPPTKN
jgi:alpha-1,3-rhamnosyltransferase